MRYENMPKGRNKDICVRCGKRANFADKLKSDVQYDLLCLAETTSSGYKTHGNVKLCGKCMSELLMWLDRKTEPTISKMEQVDEPQKDCYMCKWLGEVNVCGRCRNRNLFAEAEPQPRCPKCGKRGYIRSLESMGVKLKVFDEYRWKCTNCNRYFKEEPKDEPHTEGVWNAGYKTGYDKEYKDAQKVKDSQDLVKDLVKAFCEDGTWLERQGVYTLTLAEAKQRAVDIIESVTQTETQKSNLTFEKDECAKEYEYLGLKELNEMRQTERSE